MCFFWGGERETYVLADWFNTEDTISHLVPMMENACLLMAPGVDEFVWVMDYTGFGKQPPPLNPSTPVKDLPPSPQKKEGKKG